MIRIHNNFVGGNIQLIKRMGQDVYLRNELRDMVDDWFYWAFCIEGAQGETLTFHLGHGRVGYWGPAVSHDRKEWTWLNTGIGGDTFTYTFREDEDCVYFAHHMLYDPDRFSALLQRHGLSAGELCKSPKGRSVPFLSFGEGAKTILLTARHHACESTGSYVLEGALDELLSAPMKDVRIICVPFVDYDGMMDGDQGKSRIPHDHNRDYTDAPIYPEVRAICALRERYGVHFGTDFHSPLHLGGNSDKIFIVRNMTEKLDRFDRFSDLFAEEISPDSMNYRRDNDFPPCTGWNKPSTNCAYTTNCRPECDLAFALESTYFGTEDNKVNASRLLELGKSLGRAWKTYAEK